MKRFWLLCTLGALTGCGAPSVDLCDRGERSWTVYDSESGYFYNWSESNGDVRVVDNHDGVVGNFGPSEEDAKWTCIEAREYVYGRLAIDREAVGL